MQDTNINIRATKKDKRLHAKAAKVAGNKQKAVIAGLHHVVEECSVCGQNYRGVGFRSVKGFPVCTDCAETTDVKLNNL